MDYDSGVLPLAGAALLVGVLCIVFRTQVAAASAGTHEGPGDEAGGGQARMARRMTAAGVAMVVLSLGVVAAGFLL